MKLESEVARFKLFSGEVGDMDELIVFQCGWTCSFVHVLELHPSYQCHWASLDWHIAVRFDPYLLYTGVVL